MKRLALLLPLLAIAVLTVWLAAAPARAAVPKQELLDAAESRCTEEERAWIGLLYSNNPIERGGVLGYFRATDAAATIALPRVAELLSDGTICDPFRMASVGEEAAELISHMAEKGVTEAFDAAVAASTNRNARVRRNAAWAFPIVRGRAATNAVPHLLVLLRDRDRETRNRAAQALSGVRMEPFGNDPGRWMHWYEHSDWTSPDRHSYRYFALFSDGTRAGPQVHAPLDATRIGTYTNEYFEVRFAPGQFGRIVEVKKHEGGQTVWTRSYTPKQSHPERDELYLP